MGARCARRPEGTILPTTAEIMAVNVRETRREMTELNRKFQDLLKAMGTLIATSQQTIKAVRGGCAAVRGAAKTRGLREGQLRSEIARLTADNAELHKLLNGETEEMLGDFAKSLKKR